MNNDLKGNLFKIASNRQKNVDLLLYFGRNSCEIALTYVRLVMNAMNDIFRHFVDVVKILLY